MHHDFLIALAKGFTLANARKRLIEKIEADAEAQKKTIEADYDDAVLVAAGLRADESSTARKVAEAFMEDAMQAAGIKVQNKEHSD